MTDSDCGGLLRGELPRRFSGGAEGGQVCRHGGRSKSRNRGASAWYSERADATRGDETFLFWAGSFSSGVFPRMSFARTFRTVNMFVLCSKCRTIACSGRRFSLKGETKALLIWRRLCRASLALSGAPCFSIVRGKPRVLMFPRPINSSGSCF